MNKKELVWFLGGWFFGMMTSGIILGLLNR